MNSPHYFLARRPPRLLSAMMVLAVMSVTLQITIAQQAKLPARIELEDQHEKKHVITFPAKTITVISLADRYGREEANQWAASLAAYKNRAAIHGIADASGTPDIMKSMIRQHIQKAQPQELLIDWTGATSTAMGRQPKVANLIIVSRRGTVLHRIAGAPTPANVRAFTAAMDQALAREK